MNEVWPLLKEFFHLLDIKEDSTWGESFRPNRIVSCRAIDGARINVILKQLKTLVEAQMVRVADNADSRGFDSPSTNP